MTSFENRLLTLERKMTEVCRDQADTRRLAAGASQDVGDVQAALNAHIKTLEALRETQLEHGDAIQRLDEEMTAGFARINENFVQVNENFAKVDEKFAKVDEKFARIDEKFARVDEKFDLLHEGQTKITELLTQHLQECAKN